MIFPVNGKRLKAGRQPFLIDAVRMVIVDPDIPLFFHKPHLMIHSPRSGHRKFGVIPELSAKHDINVLHTTAGSDNRNAMGHTVVDHLLLHPVTVGLQFIFVGAVIHRWRQRTSPHYNEEIPLLIENHLHILRKIGNGLRDKAQQFIEPHIAGLQNIHRVTVLVHAFSLGNEGTQIPVLDSFLDLSRPAVKA